MSTQDEDWGSFMVRCFAENGFVVERFNERAFFKRGDPGGEAYREAGERCHQAAVEAGLALDFENPEHLTEYYRAAVEHYECLVSHGYLVPPLPSEEVFVEELGWDPGSLMGVFEYIEAYEACPSDHWGTLDLRDANFGD